MYDFSSQEWRMVTEEGLGHQITLSNARVCSGESSFFGLEDSSPRDITSVVLAEGIHSLRLVADLFASITKKFGNPGGPYLIPPVTMYTAPQPVRTGARKHSAARPCASGNGGLSGSGNKLVGIPTSCKTRLVGVSFLELEYGTVLSLQHELVLLLDLH